MNEAILRAQSLFVCFRPACKYAFLKCLFVCCRFPWVVERRRSQAKSCQLFRLCGDFLSVGSPWEPQRDGHSATRASACPAEGQRSTQSRWPSKEPSVIFLIENLFKMSVNTAVCHLKDLTCLIFGSVISVASVFVKCAREHFSFQRMYLFIYLLLQTLQKPKSIMITASTVLNKWHMHIVGAAQTHLKR